jgi:hypothetical protein
MSSSAVGIGGAPPLKVAKAGGIWPKGPGIASEKPGWLKPLALFGFQALNTRLG